MPRRAMPERKPEHVWLDHVQPTGLVVSTLVLGELGLVPSPQGPVETAQFAAIDETPETIATLFTDVLGWPPNLVAGGFGSLPLPDDLNFSLADHDTLLESTMAVKAVGGDGWQLLVRIEDEGIGLDKRGALPGWEATPHQRFERLLRETGVGTGVLVGDEKLRLVTAPRGETSGWIEWPLQALGTIAGRDMLGGLKLLLGTPALFTNQANARLPQLLIASRARQAEVSNRLAGQVLAALHTLLRGFADAEPELIRELAEARPQHLYEGLLSVLLRLVFILYAEDRDLMPSHPTDGGRELYEQGYALRGLLAQLDDDAALNPDTMDERRGAWGRLLALFGLVHHGYPEFMQARGGKLFDPAAFPFLMGKSDAGEPDRVPFVSDGCVHGVLRSLMVVGGERLSYRTLDVEQIGSVYETVMGFTVERTIGRALAIKGGKNNRTPVFVDLDRLATLSPADRMKALKDDAGRGSLGARAERGVRAATDAQDLASALGEIADERASPAARSVPAGTPILQPTDERRRTGSHYTPRELTEPIVRHALEPAFARIGEDAKPDDVLALKVCDPAMGSGAFLVEACRQLGERLTRAWEVRPDLKPAIPADEDEDLHARRLVAQRCLYGVDKNAMAVDLAKLSLWLATLARDHEFSFLDHALKCGDSLVGLTRRQIGCATFEQDPAQQTLWAQQVSTRVERVLTHRDAIRAASDDVSLAIQETRHAEAERELARVRLLGDAIVAAFFAHSKDRARLEAARELAGLAGSETWSLLEQRSASLHGGAHLIRPFHWEVEFPEVFARGNPGFDVFVGNPPFLGGKRISAEFGDPYREWLASRHPNANQNVDLVGHFFLRAFDLTCSGGSFGLVATNTIGQGATREGVLVPILKGGGSIYSAVRRLAWPGDAAVVISVVHVLKGQSSCGVLDGKTVERISAYLTDGELDESPNTLEENAGLAYVGAYLLGKGLTFDDAGAQKGDCLSIAEMECLFVEEPRSKEVVQAFIGGDEINSHPQHTPSRYCINFQNFPLAEVETQWPLLLDVVRRFVKPLRDRQKRSALRDRWWQFAERQVSLYGKIEDMTNVIVCGQTSKYTSFAMVATGPIFSHKTIVFCSDSLAMFACLHSRIHELWCRAFGPTMKDDPVYTPSDCFETYPLAPAYDKAPALEAAGHAYHGHRAQMMSSRNQGMTQTYNRFHRPDDTDDDIAELRRLHAAMDEAVLRAYGWDDLADTAAAEFLDESNEDDHKYQKRLFWPAPFRDEVLARLLKLNEERWAAEQED